jgi:hypothetical protein
MIKYTAMLLSVLLGSDHVCRGDELADLQAQRVKTLQQAADQIEAQYRGGQAAAGELLDAQAALLDAKLDAASTPQQRIEVLTQQVKLSARAENVADALVRAGQAKQSDFLLAKAARLRVAVMLLKEKRLVVEGSSPAR